MLFPYGRQILCLDSGNNIHITTGNKYTVLNNDDNHNNERVLILNDKGNQDWYFSNRFKLIEPESLYDLIEKARGLIGKNYTVVDGPTKYKCTRIKTYLQEEDFEGGMIGSVNAQKMFKELGYAVVAGSSTQEDDVRDCKECPNSREITLTPDYQAEIYADKVIVGCQTIPKDKIVELLKVMEELSIN